MSCESSRLSWCPSLMHIVLVAGITNRSTRSWCRASSACVEPTDTWRDWRRTKSDLWQLMWRFECVQTGASVYVCDRSQWLPRRLHCCAWACTVYRYWCSVKCMFRLQFICLCLISGWLVVSVYISPGHYVSKITCQWMAASFYFSWNKLH